MIIYIDMDDTICDFIGGIAQNRDIHKFPQSLIGFFEGLEPIEGAIDAVNELRELADVWILTAPSVKNPRSYMEKRLWIEKYFGEEFCHKLILCPNKGLLKGDLLIDDRLQGKGQESFGGQALKFGFDPYTTWPAVMEDVRFVIKNFKK